MTDDLRPHEPRAGADDADALASAYLDGEATAAERAVVESDPALLARVEAFRRVAARVGAAAPVPAEAGPAMVEAALAAADDSGEAGTRSGGARSGGAAPPPPAIQLADRRRRRMALPVPAVAAAVVVLLLVGLGLLLTAGGDDAADTAATGGASRQTQDAAAAPSTTTKAADDDEAAGESAPTAEPTVADLGSFPDEAALRALLARVDPATLGPDAESTAPSPSPGEEDNQPPPGEIERCDDAVRAQVEQFQGRTLDDRAAVAAADLAGRPVLVYSHPVLDDPGAADQLTVADAGTCQILAVVQR